MKKDLGTEFERNLTWLISTGLAGFAIIKVSILAPQFILYVIGIFALGVAIWLVWGKTRRAIALKCPKCGGAMLWVRRKKIFAGRPNLDNKRRPFSSLALNIKRCEDCGNEHHQLMYYSGYTGDFSENYEIFAADTMVLDYLGEDVPLALRNKDFTKRNKQGLTEAEYLEIENAFIENLFRHNENAGFSRNINDIKVNQRG